MAQSAPSSKPPQNKVARIGKSLIVLLLFAIAGVIVFNYLQKQPGSFLAAPEEYQLQYMPSEYKVNVDPDQALAILQNPQRYRREFDNLVYEINTGILNHVSRRMGLSDSLQTAVVREYDRQHPQFADLYFNDFMAIRDTSGSLYETWYDSEGANVSEIFNEVASKYTCFLVNKVLAAVITTRDGNILAKGSGVQTPCGLAMGEALAPLVKRMKERAAIEDFSRSKGLLQEKVERVIAELATMEIRDKKGINKNLQTKIWGMSVSKTDVEITAISILKVGFRLNDYFDIQLDDQANLVTITLPEPVILSHEVYPKIERLDIGWMRELESININEGINSLRAEFRREAIESNAMERSKVQATELMNTMFLPLIQSMNGKYQLKIGFQRQAEADLGETALRD